MSDSESNSSLAFLFSKDTVIVESDVRIVDDQLFPEELAHIQNAVPKRRAEFGTGRVCARRALARLGLEAVPIAIGPGGAPVWPQGVVGSITHTTTYCAAVVKSCPPWRAVGLDAEDIRRADTEIVNAISTENERRWLSRLPPDSRPGHGALLFSAKEAFYKLQYPLTGRFLEFRDVEIEVDSSSQGFRVLPVTEMPRELVDPCGRFRFEHGRVLCGLELPAQTQPGTWGRLVR